MWYLVSIHYLSLWVWTQSNDATTMSGTRDERGRRMQRGHDRPADLEEDDIETRAALSLKPERWTDGRRREYGTRTGHEASRLKYVKAKVGIVHGEKPWLSLPSRR